MSWPNDAAAASAPLVMEDDGLGDLAPGRMRAWARFFRRRPCWSAVTPNPMGRTSGWLFFGGPAEPLERARLYRQFGAGWTSGTLQNALAWMLSSDAVKAQVQHARTEYAKRRTHMANLLADRGVIVESHDDGLAALGSCAE